MFSLVSTNVLITTPAESEQQIQPQLLELYTGLIIIDKERLIVSHMPTVRNGTECYQDRALWF